MTLPIWQLRMSSKKNIQDLVKQFAMSVMESLEREIDFGEEGLGNSLLTLEQPLIDALFSYVKAYNTCGRHVVCTTNVDSVSCPDFDDNIYILYLPFGVDGLIDEVVVKSLKPFVGLLDEQLYEDVRSRAKASIQRILRSHLYVNPQCRNHDVCRIAQEVDPWPVSTMRVLQ